MDITCSDSYMLFVQGDIQFMSSCGAIYLRLNVAFSEMDIYNTEICVHV